MDHTHYDYRVMQPPPDFAAHMQMPHIPLPLDTPLPPSSYDFTSHGSFPISQNIHGPQAHPLFEGVLAMHQMLGHDLNLAWPDVAQCNQQSSMPYPGDGNGQYCAQPVHQMQQWSTPPPSIMDPTPSPLDESLPHTPEQIIELIPEPVGHHHKEPSPAPSLVQNPGFAMFPLVVTGAKTHEHTIAFQADVRAALRHSLALILTQHSSDKSQRRQAQSLTRTRPTSSGRSSASADGTSFLLVWPRGERRHRRPSPEPT